MNKKLILLGLLATALIFSCKQAEKSSNNGDVTNSSAGPNIVFINLDSLLEKYELYTDSRTLLEDESRKAEQAIASKLETFQKRAYDYQRRLYETQQKAAELAPVQLKTLEQNFAAEQAKLAKEEQDLAAKRNSAAAELDKKIVDLQKNLKEKIDAHMEKISAERNYDYVLVKSSATNGVLFGRKALDITDQTIKELNELYKKGGETPSKLINEVVKDTVK
jgi:outer membrane protein